MPTTPTYPGVYIEEVPSGVRTITGVATSITAFIGRARKGTVNKPITINSYADYEREFGGLWLKSTMSVAVRDFYRNGGRQAIIVRLFNPEDPDDSSKTVEGKAKIRIPTGGAAPHDELCLEAANEGTWGNNLSVTVNYETKDYLEGNPNTDLFNLFVSELDPDTKGTVSVERFANVSINKEDARYLPKVLEERSQLVRVVKDIATCEYPELNIRPLPTAVAITPLSPPTSPPMSPPASATDGHDGFEVTREQFNGAGLRDGKQGLYALEKADLFNILCIPPFTSEDDIDTDLIADAVGYCKERRAFFIIDPPSSWTSKKTAKEKFIATSNAFPGTTSNYAGIFFPRLKYRNPLRDNQMEEFVPCGAAAGVFARTDAERGVWKAPAGQEARLAGVSELSVPLTDDENGELNQLGMNCLRAFPLVGPLVWGSRTLEGADRLASEWKYIPVRRTALFIEESLYRGTQWVVFEPNDEPLWSQIRLNVTAFMHNLFRQEAFQGQTPKQAYLVKCDKETTTQNDINLGIVNILVGFAPLKPAEFVFIKIQQLAGQIEA
jgi:phage tail sheath protein FI